MRVWLAAMGVGLAWQAVGCGGEASGLRCTTQDDCGTGFACVQQACLQICNYDQDCPKDQLCADIGVCAAGAGECGADAQCLVPPSPCHQSPGVCLGGACTYPEKQPDAACSAPGDHGPCATAEGSCNASGECVYGVRAGQACTLPGGGGPCAADAGLCALDGTCQYPVEPGKTCTTPGYHGPCAQASGSCDQAGVCVYGWVAPGTPCAGSDPCQEDFACDALGACVGRPIVCADPPDLHCLDADTLVTYKFIGRCSGGQCSYEGLTVPCQTTGSCTGSFPACLANPCANPNLTCPDEVCSATGTCYNGYCLYAGLAAYAACDGDGDGTDDGLCSGPGSCDATICVPPGLTSHIAEGQRNPANDCQRCAPDLDQHAWSPLAAGVACRTTGGQPGVCHDPGTGLRCSSEVCFIDGQFYAAGAGQPGNSCALCQPAVEPSGWTAVNELQACSGQPGLCVAGRCQSVCDIGGVLRSAGAPHPENVCLVCDPARSTSAWLPRGDGGVGCVLWNGTLGVCDDGLCSPACYIDGASFPDGYQVPAGCRSCDVEQSIFGWTVANDGRACPGGYCDGGLCVGGCLISGQIYPEGSVRDPSVYPCQWCDRDVSPTSWSPRGDYAYCGGGAGLCKAGTCNGTLCYIAGSEYAAGALDPTNGCASCAPASSRTGWTTAPDGAGCGSTGRYCYDGTCRSNSCWIDGALWADDALNPLNVCQWCDYAAPTSWSPRPGGTSCGSGCSCQGGNPTETWCFDGYDNDHDGSADCADLSCSSQPCSFTPGTTARVSANADAYVRQDAPATNYGGSYQYLYLYDHGTSARVAYVGFDLTSFTPMAGVLLRLRLSDQSGACGGVRVSAHLAEAAWTEAGVTWNNRPPRGLEVGALTIDSPTTNADYFIPVTRYVLDVKAGWRANNGLLLQIDNRVGCQLGFYDRANGAIGPVLVDATVASGPTCNYSTGQCQ